MNTIVDLLLYKMYFSIRTIIQMKLNTGINNTYNVYLTHANVQDSQI